MCLLDGWWGMLISVFTRLRERWGVGAIQLLWIWRTLADIKNLCRLSHDRILRRGGLGSVEHTT